MPAKRPLYYAAIAGLVTVSLLSWAVRAGDDGRLAVAPTNDAVVVKECSACHMLYPPGFLSAQSWTRLMAGLSDHFGENATLDEATKKHITDYLVANAAKTSPGLVSSSAEPPIRISELPWFKREHREVGAGMLKRRGAKSMADCKACHAGAERGLFEED